eukprot:15459638-Alexandrium_andersonii.AAC.1
MPASGCVPRSSEAASPHAASPHGSAGGCLGRSALHLHGSPRPLPGAEGRGWSGQCRRAIRAPGVPGRRRRARGC